MLRAFEVKKSKALSCCCHGNYWDPHLSNSFKRSREADECMCLKSASASCSFFFSSDGYVYDTSDDFARAWLHVNLTAVLFLLAVLATSNTLGL